MIILKSYEDADSGEFGIDFEARISIDLGGSTEYVATLFWKIQALRTIITNFDTKTITPTSSQSLPPSDLFQKSLT